MKSFKEFIDENNQMDEDMGKLKTAIAAGLIGAMAGNALSKNDHKPAVTQTAVKPQVKQQTKEKNIKKKDDSGYTDAAVAGIIGQM
jgi:uncharacterized membrane protein YeaQ/YmgE (transglycosylase-associated protein family)